MVERTAAISGYEQVGAPVVVVVSDRAALPEAAGAQTAPRRRIGERAVAVVAVVGDLVWPQEHDVEPAVALEIGHGRAVPECFQNGQRAAVAVSEGKCDAGTSRDVTED